MPSAEPEVPFTKQMASARPAWMCGCCSGSSRPVVAPNSAALSVTAVAASPGKSSGASTPSSTTASSSSSGAHHHVCCCGMSVLGVIRLSFLLALLMALVFSLLFFHEAKDFFLDTLTYVNELGPLRGSLVLCIANIIGALLFMPCVPFTLGAGFLYGTLIGSVIVSIASTVAAVIAFLSARYLARNWIERTCLGGRASKFRILDQAIREDGFRIVLLIRSSPLHPYGIMNYFFGITAVTARDYTVASFLGMLPSTVMEVYFGSATKTVGAIIQGNVENSMLSRIFFWAGLGCTVVVTVILTVILKRKLRTEMDKYQAVATEADGDDDDDDDFGLMAGLGESGVANHHLPVGARDSAVELHEPALSDTELTPALPKSTVAARLDSPDNRRADSRKSSEANGLSVALPASARRQHKLSASSVHSGIHAALATPISTPVLSAAASTPLKPPPDLALHSHHSISPHSHGHAVQHLMRDEENILDENEALIFTKNV